MFEVGKSYTFHVEDMDGYSTSTLKVVEWNSPLLKVRRHGVEAFVLNTSSQRFLKAEPSDHDADELIVLQIVRSTASGGPRLDFSALGKELG